MVKKNVLILLWLFSLSSWAVTFPDKAKDNNQLADSVNKTLTLIFCVDANHYNIHPDSIRAIYAWGSISDYKDAVPACRITQFSEDSCFYKTYNYDEIARPGDSGQPEFEFYVELTDSSTWYFTPDTIGPHAVDSSLMFFNGVTPVLIVLPGGPEYMTTDLNELYNRRLEAREIRPLSDYDLTDSVDQHRISNFRLTAGTVNLYRSYHPYYPSMTRRDTEAERLHWVAELASQVGIRSDISLTGNLSYAVGRTYTCGGEQYTVTMPDYYQAIIDSGNVKYVYASALECYYYPDSANFAHWIRQVVEFIIDEQHPMPMQIHCAIGADRTGVICSVISALCGAEWTDIMADYHATTDMKVQTYRHPNRIRYVMQRLTGLNPDLCTSAELAAAIRAHLVNTMGVLTNEQIDKMVCRLTQTEPSAVEQVGPLMNDEMWYDVLGRPVNADYRGIRISSNGQKQISLP